jgi:hypothetical protein
MPFWFSLCIGVAFMLAWGGILVLLVSLLLPARWYNPWLLWFLGSLSPIILIWGVAAPLFLIHDAARAYRVRRRRRRRAHRAKRTAQ